MRPGCCIPLAWAALLAGGCGSSSGRPDLLVSAASSLQAPFTAFARDLPGARARFSFAGSDQLAAQIRAGARPDVLATADVGVVEQLHAAGLVGRPARFARNRLVVAVPARDARVRSLADLALPRITIALGSPSAPVGKYTRAVLARLPLVQRRAILANVRSREPDVAGVVGKVAQGAVDAGVVYATDVTAARGALRQIPLPSRLQPDVVYAAAVVRGARHAPQARAFVEGLLDGAGRAALRRAGFRPPP